MKNEFNKVAGYEEEKKELYRILDTFKNKQKYKKLGVRPIRKLLIIGDTGTGKTTMAECFVKASKLNSYTIRKSDSSNDFVKKVISTFKEAKKNKPSIIFFEDLDMYSNEDFKNADEYVIIESCMEKYKNDDIFILATATDFYDLPSFFQSEGKFDKQIELNIFTPDDSTEKIKHFLKNKKIDKDVEIKEIAKLLDGDDVTLLETIINSAAEKAAFKNNKTIKMEDIIESCFEYEMEEFEGKYIKKNRVSKEVIYYVAGRAFVSEYLKPGSIKFATIKIKDKEYSFSPVYQTYINRYKGIKESENRIISLLAGKATIDVLLGDQCIKGNLDTIKASVETYDVIFEKSKYYFYGDKGTYIPEKKDYKHVNRKIMSINSITVASELERYYQETKRIIINNKETIEKLAKELQKKELLSSKDIQKIIQKGGKRCNKK